MIFNVSIIKRIVKFILSLWLLVPVLKHCLQIYRLNKRFKIAIVALTEHMGDIVACEPVVRFLKKEDDNLKLIWVINKKFRKLVDYNPHISLVVPVNYLTEWIYLKTLVNNKILIYDLHIHKRECIKYGLKVNNPNILGITLRNYYNFGSLVEIFSMSAGLPKISDQPKFYFPNNYNFPHDLPDEYVVVQVSSREESRNWDFVKWEELIMRHPATIFIELGMTSNLHPLKNCISSFCGSINLMDISFIIKNAKLFIGIDSVFAHFANAHSIPGIILLGHYESFTRYCPYAELYRNNSIADIINYDGPVYNLPVDLVDEKLQTRLRMNVAS